jgi:hypothetical protein
MTLCPASKFVAKDELRHRESVEIVDLIDGIAHQSGLHRQRVFDDWLFTMVASLSGGQMEADYLKVVQPYVAGKKGKRPIDSFARAFANLVDAMSETRADILGDVFEGAITRGAAGQFLTPEPIADLMVQMVADEARTLSDPCCGTGRMFLAAVKAHPLRLWEFVGQDIDLRCVRITAINLALWNQYAWVLHGNSLTTAVKLAYRTGFDGKGVIREVPGTDYTKAIAERAAPEPPVESKMYEDTSGDELPPVPRPHGRQRRLFDEES